MCAVHPAYDGQSIVVMADSCRVTVYAVKPLEMVTFGRDFPVDAYRRRQARDNVPKIFSVFDELDNPAVIGVFASATAQTEEKYKPKDAVTLEELAAHKTVALNNSFFAESRLGRPK